MGRRIVKMNSWMSAQPPVMLGLVSVQVIEDHVDLPLGAVGDHLVHEIEKLPMPPPLVVPGFELTGCDVEGRKEGRCPVAPVPVVEVGKGFAAWKARLEAAATLEHVREVGCTVFLNTDHKRDRGPCIITTNSNPASCCG